MCFQLLDADKNGILDNDDIVLVAKRMANYRNEGTDAERYYVECIKSILFSIS